MNQHRSELYLGLAEALMSGGPPAWLAKPGREWPLYECVTRLAEGSSAARRASQAIAGLPGETVDDQRIRHERLFEGPGRPQFWMYESMYRSRRLFGPETLAVEKLYREAGVEVQGSELPDHASIELAFLAHLAGQKLLHGLTERKFILEHAGRWLPGLGRSLASTGDPVYGPIGELLAGWLEEAVWPDKKNRNLSVPENRLPAIQAEENCSLCGFCVQVCPTHALSIIENQDETALLLSPAACVRCRKCERVCEFQAIQILPQPVLAEYPMETVHSPEKVFVLRKSTLVACHTCGEPIASQAEVDFVRRQLGFPVWLDYCLECRTQIN
jgi:TorA maturation chaperone TorD/NAD-dependent dihydropyrimidine dehydrogenase PreA subunit